MTIHGCFHCSYVGESQSVLDHDPSCPLRREAERALKAKAA